MKNTDSLQQDDTPKEKPINNDLTRAKQKSTNNITRKETCILYENNDAINENQALSKSQPNAVSQENTNEIPRNRAFTRSKQKSTNSINNRVERNYIYENNDAIDSNQELTKVRQPKPVPIPCQKVFVSKNQEVVTQANEELCENYEYMTFMPEKQPIEYRKNIEETFYEVPPTR